jgi:hypothetical protein
MQKLSTYTPLAEYPQDQFSQWLSFQNSTLGWNQRFHIPLGLDLQDIFPARLWKPESSPPCGGVFGGVADAAQ